MHPPVIDFETEPIEAYPNFPPKPVGVSILTPGEQPRYYAWGHPSENNCTREDAAIALGRLWDADAGPLFHNGRFDIAVGMKEFGFSFPRTFHDTLFLSYLNNPNAPSLSLKPLAHSLLGMPPEEQDELVKYLRSKGLQDYDYAKAPGGLVGAYANGDVLRTLKLYEHTYPLVERAGMLAAYNREIRLAPILSANEKDGIRVNWEKLETDLPEWEKVYVRISDAILAQLGNIDLDSGASLAHALIAKGLANEDDFLRTEKTKAISTSKDSLDKALRNSPIRPLLRYRSTLKTILSTFMRPWTSIARANSGRLHPQFHQTRGTEKHGTRTGRLSSSDPNFQNVITHIDFDPPEGYPRLPYMREYVLPDEGHILVASDFKSQEFRIAAHYAEGQAAQIYRDDPHADFHAVVAELLLKITGLALDRKHVKILGFSLLYGAGIQTIADRLGITYEKARDIKAQYFHVLPGMKMLMRQVSDRGSRGEAITTWGGRKLYAEESRLAYKLTNYLIQGSAADLTKEAVCRKGYRTLSSRFMITVHDENVYSIDPTKMREEIEQIRWSMEDTEGWDIPWGCDVEHGPDWHNLEEYV